MKRILYPLTVALLMTLSHHSTASDSSIDDAFLGSDNQSTYTISYDDYTEILKNFVLNNSRSTREKAPQSSANIGTRFKPKISRLTALEGNRFDYREYKKHDNLMHRLTEIRKSFEAIPEQLPLRFLSEQEQLAFWFNLHNIRVIEYLANAYPLKDLKKAIATKEGFFNQKSVRVAGVDLSLNDIQQLVRIKFDEPDNMYGFYHGNIGGPDLPVVAFTGDKVENMLKNNAVNFVNSNRGTYAKAEDQLLVSAYYHKNKDYFPNFQQDLERHLIRHLDGMSHEYFTIYNTDELKSKIANWKITDLTGGVRQFGGSSSTNAAALLNAFTTVSYSGSSSGGYSSSLLSFTTKYGRFSGNEVEQLKAIRDNIVQANAKVKITDIEQKEPATDEQKSRDEQ